MRPDRQAQAVKALHSARLLAADAMLSYVTQQMTEAKDVLRRAQWDFWNEDEFAAPGRGGPGEFSPPWGAEGLVFSAGARGGAGPPPQWPAPAPAHAGK